MRKLVTILFSAFSVFAYISPAEAADNVITPYTLNNDYFSMSISLENLSRPTFQVIDGVKSPIFVPGDNVSYSITLNANRDFIWSKANALITKQYGTKYVLNDVKMHLAIGLKYGDDESFGISETYQYQTNQMLENNLKGVMKVPAKKNLILTWAGIDLQGIAQPKAIVYKNGSNQQYLSKVTLELDVIDLVENQVVFMDVSKTPQSINPLTLNPVSISHQFLQLTTVATSNLPLTGMSNTTGTCSYMSGVVAFKKVGNCLIILTQPGNEVYAAAKPLVLSFKITKANKNVKLCNGVKKITEVSKSKSCPIS